MRFKRLTFRGKEEMSSEVALWVMPCARPVMPPRSSANGTLVARPGFIHCGAVSMSSSVSCTKGITTFRHRGRATSPGFGARRCPMVRKAAGLRPMAARCGATTRVRSSRITTRTIRCCAISQPVGEKVNLTEAFTREAEGFISRHKSQPFFLYLANNCPHSPLQGAGCLPREVRARR